MLIRKTRGLVAATAILATVCLGAGTSAAKAPPEFYGVVPQSNLGSADFDRMGTGKVGTVRLLLNWGSIDPSAASGDNNFSGFDPLVLDAARNGIEVLPFIFGTPAWVAQDLDNKSCSPAKCVLYAPKSPAALAAWGEFVGDVVDRYGPNGTLWAEHPNVPQQPFDVYQIWNEQNSKSFYLPKPSPKQYAKLLAAAHDAIDAKDSSADVVLGGMAELAGSRKAIAGSEYLEELYDVRGVKKRFEGVAPHPYGATIAKVSSQVVTYRKVMKQAGDSGASMYVTEIGAGSKSGGNSLNRGARGQASLLKDIFKYFAKKRNSFNVETVDWFSWQDISQSICSWCASSGLLTTSGQAKPSYNAFTKLTGGSPSKHKR